MDNLIERQAAIIQLSHNKNGDDDCDVIVQKDIETIKQLPSAQPEITVDGYADGFADGYKQGQKDAQPERKKGHWEMVPDPYGFFEEIPVCSECGCTTEMRKTYKFCPNCGVDMRGE